jgi:hypothetical protein
MRPRVLTAGASLFSRSLTEQAVNVTAIDWRPPGFAGVPNDGGLAVDLARVAADPRRSGANQGAAARMLAAGALLIDVLPAREAIGLARDALLHAGPPLDLDRINGPMLAALRDAAIQEGLADAPAEAERLLRNGRMALAPGHSHQVVSPAAGVVSASTWVFKLENPATGGHAFCPISRTAQSDRMNWIDGVLGPLLQHAVRARNAVGARSGPVNITDIIAQGLQMGDDGHYRNRAGTLLLLRDLLPNLTDSPFGQSAIADAVASIAGNDQFFLNLSMPACKLAAEAAGDLPGSSIVVAMASNGNDFGLQVSGTGDRWVTAPADGGFDLGDTPITETAGIGGCALAADPARVRFGGGDAALALASTTRMYEITQAENPAFGIPALDFRGTPTGIDVTQVVRTGILPPLGSSWMTPPARVFRAALRALAETAKVDSEVDADVHVAV